jgi:hypothetical protein
MIMSAIIASTEAERHRDITPSYDCQNASLLTRIIIMEKRMQNENDKNKLAEMERARAGMVAAYRCRLTAGA